MKPMNEPAAAPADQATRLREYIKHQLAVVGKFLVILFLGLVAALLMALPWALRLASVLAWLAGAYVLMVAIGDLYSPFSPTPPVIALQFVVIETMVAWVGILLQRRGKQDIWGGLAISGVLSLLMVRLGIPYLMQWQYSRLFLAVLPPALATLLLFYITVRFRILRERKNLHLAGPAFTWLPENISKLRGDLKDDN